MRWLLPLLAVVLLTQNAAAQDTCAADLKDSLKGIDVVVEGCENIGTYSVGGLYNGEWDKLTFQYPEPWKGTFTTFDVDGSYYCTSDDARDCIFMDNYSTRKPVLARNAIDAAWQLPQVSVTQTFLISENKTQMRYVVKNTGSQNRTVGVRLHIDTMLGINDGAPIYIPGDGLKTSEVEYKGSRLNFGYWKAYNLPDKPTIVATGTIDPKLGMTYPVKVVVADWKKSKDTAWDYAPTGRAITGDSAVLLYYDLGVLEPGQEKSVGMEYGSEPPILEEEHADIGLAEIVLNSISGQYCPGDAVQVKVDVLSPIVDRTGSVGLVISGDGKTYYDSRQNAAFPRGQVKTMQYDWQIPEVNGSEKYSVRAVLYNDTGTVAVKERQDAIRIDQSKCQNPAIQIGTEVVGGFLLVAIVISVGLLAATLAYLWYSKGTVDYTKFINAEYVKVSVINNTKKTMRDVIIEDVIPPEAEIKVLTLNVERRQNTLTWRIGDLRPKDSATLDYWVSGGHASSQSLVRWDRGFKKL